MSCWGSLGRLTTTFVWVHRSARTCGGGDLPRYVEWCRYAARVWHRTAGSLCLDGCVRRFSCGAVYPASQQWVQLQWPESYREGELTLREESITLKDLLPVVLACAAWGWRWRRSAVVVHCDNMGAVAAVNSGYSRIPGIMHLLRCLFFIWAHFELTVWAVHIPGKLNTLGDAVSRNNLSYFFSQMQGATNIRWASFGRTELSERRNAEKVRVRDRPALAILIALSGVAVAPTPEIEEWSGLNRSRRRNDVSPCPFLLVRWEPFARATSV